MSFYFSSGAFKTRRLDEVVKQCLEERIRHLELSSGLAHSETLLDPVRRTSGVQMSYLAHNYFPPPHDPFVLNLAAAEPQGLARSMELCRGAIDLTVELGAPFYSAHAGFAMTLMPAMLGDPRAQGALSDANVQPYEQAYEVFVESVRALCAYARERGVRFLVENNALPPTLAARGRIRGLLMLDAAELHRLVADVDDAAFGLLIDVGHAKVSSVALGFDPVELIESLAEHIAAFHLSDNDGQTDQNRMFDERAWFAPLLRDFPEATMVIEVYRLSAEERRQQARVVERLLG
jgi:sugar phosphate isomerase/epimerase